MTATAGVLLALGVLLAMSILIDALARRSGLPRVSLLIMVGVSVSVARVILPGNAVDPWDPALAEPLIQLALVMVAFLLGGELTVARLRRLGPLIALVSAVVVATSVATIGGGLLALGYAPAVAVSLAAIGVATDPAAVLTAVHDSASPGSLTARLLKGVVAIDDAWGIIVFGGAMVLLDWHAGSGGDGALWHAGRELVGAVILGVGLGLPAAWLTGRLRPGEPTQVEAVALILLIAGLAELLAVSALLLAMVTGTIIANVATHHDRAFHEIEHIEWPFLVFFFVFSGARLELNALAAAAGLMTAYIGLRFAGRYLGGWLVAQHDTRLSPHLGLALTPQAGIAIGMALLAAERFPEHASMLVTTAVGGTVLFELVGPWLVDRVMGRAPSDGRA